MKKFILATAIFGMLALAGEAQAQQTTYQNTDKISSITDKVANREARKEARQEKRQARKEVRQEKRQARKEVRQEKRAAKRKATQEWTQGTITSDQ